MMGDEECVIVDGSVFEGGGQILRNSVALASLLGKKIRVFNIRAGRPKPGLCHQHLTGVELTSRLCGGELSSCHVGSTELTFRPANIQSGTYEADAATAGSVSLILQVAVPVLAFGAHDSELIVRGGTDAQYAPPIDYVREVTQHYFSKMGLDCRYDVRRRGFYPEGGGIVKAKISALQRPLSAIKISNMGSLTNIVGHAFVAGRVPLKVAQEMRQEAVRYLKAYFPNCPIDITAYQESDERCRGNVAAFMFVAHTSNDCRLAVSGIGSKRGPSHAQLVSDACENLRRYIASGICCDDYMQDQLILLMALAEGRSQILCGPLTLHTQTVIYLVELLLPVKFDITPSSDQAFIVSCSGIGYFPRS